MNSEMAYWKAASKIVRRSTYHMWNFQGSKVLSVMCPFLERFISMTTVLTFISR